MSIGDRFTLDGTDHGHTETGAAKNHVQSVFLHHADWLAQKFINILPSGRCIADTQNNDVAFIPLDVFKILDEQTVELVIVDTRIRFLIAHRNQGPHSPNSLKADSIALCWASEKATMPMLLPASSNKVRAPARRYSALRVRAPLDVRHRATYGN